MRCSRQLRAAITAGSYGPAVTSNASTRVATTLKPGKSKASTSRFGLKAGTSSEHRQHDEDFGFGIPVRSQVLAGTRLSRREAARDVNRRSTRASESTSNFVEPEADGQTDAEKERAVAQAGLSAREKSNLRWLEVKLFRPGSSSQGAGRASYHPLLATTAHDFISHDRVHLLDRYVNGICIALTSQAANLHKLTDEEALRTAQILGACWVRFNELRQRARAGFDSKAGHLAEKGKGPMPKSTEEKDDWRSPSRCFARYLVSSSVMAGAPDELRSQVMLEQLERAIAAYRDRTKLFILPVHIFAAWAILRARCKSPPDIERSVRVIPAAYDKLGTAMSELLRDSGHDTPEARVIYFASMDRLIESTSAKGILPTSLEELDATLSDFRFRRETDRAVALWDQWKAALVEDSRRRSARAMTEAWMARNPPTTVRIGGSGDTPQQASAVNPSVALRDKPNPILDASHRSQVLMSFVRFCTRPSVATVPYHDETALPKMREDVVAHIPRPFPVEVHHAMINFYATAGEGGMGPDGGADVKQPVDLASVDTIGSQSSSALAVDETYAGMRKREEKLNNLRSAWESAMKDGVVDLKLYLLYIKGLGRWHDVRGLKEVWHTMCKDTKARDAYRRQVGDGKSQFPPVRALNHIISSAFLIPTSGPPAALELFHSIANPESEIKCNVVTINTVLRHYASKRDVQGMTSLIGLADDLGLAPDVITYTVLLQGLLKAGQMDIAKRTLENMSSQGIQPNERTASLLVADLVRGGDRQGLLAAEQLMREMKALKLNVGIVPWTSLIGGYFKGGWNHDAKLAMGRMKHHGGVNLNRVGYNMLLRETRESDETMDLFREMLENGIKPNGDTYSLILDRLTRQAAWEQAGQVVKHMREAGFIPEKLTIKRAIKRLEMKFTPEKGVARWK